MHIPLGLCVVGAQAMCYNYKMNPTKFLATNAMDQMDGSNGSGGGADLGSARFNARAPKVTFELFMYPYQSFSLAISRSHTFCMPKCEIFQAVIHVDSFNFVCFNEIVAIQLQTFENYHLIVCLAF